MKRRRFALDIRPGAVALLAGLYFLLPLRWCVRLALAVVVHELGHVAALVLCGAEVYGLRMEACGLALRCAPPEPLFGWKLNPMFGAAAMSLSSFCVVTNALRLNLFRMHDASKDKRIKNEISKEDLNMTTEQGMVKTMTIEGMMCGHCEARVKKTLEAIEGVASAEVSHEKGTAVVTLTAPVSDDVLKTAVEAQDYTVKGIQ